MEGLSGEPEAFHVCVAREVFEETACCWPRAFGWSDLAELQVGPGGRQAGLPRRAGPVGVRLRAADIAQLGTKTTPPMTPAAFPESVLHGRDRRRNPASGPASWTRARGERVRSPGRLGSHGPAYSAAVRSCLKPGARAIRPGSHRIGGFDDADFARHLPRVRFAPGVILASLRTATRPPAVSTNAYVVGERDFYVVDPGPTDPVEQRLLLGLIEELIAEGRVFRGVLLTHVHPDHVGAGAAVIARWPVPVYAHELARTARPLADGDKRPLAPGWDLDVLHTPGHAPDLCFTSRWLAPDRRPDLTPPRSPSTLPGGDMAAYMNSLQRVLALNARTLYPGHAPTTRSARRRRRRARAARGTCF